jgi:hypothetical protein
MGVTPRKETAFFYVECCELGVILRLFVFPQNLRGLKSRLPSLVKMKPSCVNAGAML